MSDSTTQKRTTPPAAAAGSLGYRGNDAASPKTQPEPERPHPAGAQTMPRGFVFSALPTEQEALLAEVFSSHDISGTQQAKMEAVSHGALDFARLILQACPACADRSAAIRLIREATATANAAIGLNGVTIT
jgi:hypothetical protein